MSEPFTGEIRNFGFTFALPVLRGRTAISVGPGPWPDAPHPGGGGWRGAGDPDLPAGRSAHPRRDGLLAGGRESPSGSVPA